MNHVPHNSKRRWPTYAVCLFAGLMLTRLPETVTRAVRSSLHDAVRPVDRGWKWLAQWQRTTFETDPQTLQHELAQARMHAGELELELRRQRLETAHLQEELNRREELGSERYRGADSPPLLVSDILNADLIGPDQQRLLRQGILVDAGREQSILSESLVLEGQGDPLVVDQGAEAGVPSAAPVYAGRCIVGRVDAVGRWTSRVKLVTDVEYRGRAQILRKGPDGALFGPEGLLEGTGGELCVLKYIDRTESVSVGEEVYTGGRSAAMPYPMFYGTIVKAELEPSDREWTIWIKPAVNPDNLRTVQILRHTANALRVLGH